MYREDNSSKMVSYMRFGFLGAIFLYSCLYNRWLIYIGMTSLSPHLLKWRSSHVIHALGCRGFYILSYHISVIPGKTSIAVTIAKHQSIQLMCYLFCFMSNPQKDIFPFLTSIISINLSNGINISQLTHNTRMS